MEEEEDENEEEDEAEEDNEEDSEEEEGGEGEEDDDIIWIGDEDDIPVIKVEPKQDVKQEVPKEKTTDTLQGNEATPKEETLEEKFAKTYYEWMARIEQNQIGPKVVEMDMASVLRMVEMADQEVRQHPAKFVLI
jgi:hypothetical protein